MTSVYTQPSISGYNSNPPEDDGSEVSTNEVKWQTHLDKIGDPLNTYAAAIDSAVNTAFGLVPFSTLSAITTTTSVTSSNRGTFYAATGTFTVTLPAVADATDTFTIHVANVGSGLITIDGASTETINGWESITIIPDGAATLITNGTVWYAYLSNNSWTGHIQQSFASSLPGFLLLDGSTIGSAGSGADNAGAIYQALYEFVWDNVADNEAAVTTTGGRGSTATQDFDADKPLTLPDARGRMFLGKDNMGGSSADVVTDSEADTIADLSGQETVTMTSNELVAHTHTGGAHTHGAGSLEIPADTTPDGSDAAAKTGQDAGESITVDAGTTASGGAVATSSTGSGNAQDIMNPYMTMNVFIRY